MGKTEIILLTIVLTGLFSCTQIPDVYQVSGDQPDVFPDIRDIKIPDNIAPLNFRLNNTSSDKIIAVFEGENANIIVSGKTRIQIPIRKWRRFIQTNSGGKLIVTVYENKSGKWIKYSPFGIEISNISIDPYIVYRLIAPGYESWSSMGIYQRNLTNFDEDPIIDNRMLTGNCMNCHSFNKNDPGKFVFHLRGKIGATILNNETDIIKLNTKTDNTISNCVYPYWHPSGNYISFSTNIIYQYFHTDPAKRIEVSDTESDLVVYDIKSNRLISNPLIASKTSFETFPTFSNDGKFLIFCSAQKTSIPADYDKIRYSLCTIPFDEETGKFGSRVDTLISSFSTGKSVSFPRVSRDGKWLMFTLSEYGNFSIWHKEADLYLMNMEDRTVKPVSSANSNDTESYHSWSSNSNWFIFSSRRTDGLYTRPYIAWIDDNGESSKPFLLPQKNPDYYDFNLRSFNVPELVSGRVKANGKNMIRTIQSEAQNVEFRQTD